MFPLVAALVLSGLGGVLAACALPERYSRGKAVDLSAGPSPAGPQWVQVFPPKPAVAQAAPPPRPSTPEPTPPPALAQVAPPPHSSTPEPVEAPSSASPLEAPRLLPAAPLGSEEAEPRPVEELRPSPSVLPASLSPERPPCQPVPKPPPAPPAERRLQLHVRISPDANDTSPVALSVLVIYDPIVARALRELSASQWFEDREQFLQDYLTSIDEELWELVPGQRVEPIVRTLREGTAEGLLFARYRSEGLHSQVFSPEQPVQLLLGSKAFSLTQNLAP